VYARWPTFFNVHDGTIGIPRSYLYFYPGWLITIIDNIAYYEQRCTSLFDTPTPILEMNIVNRASPRRSTTP
jgi:hypothetical protein